MESCCTGFGLDRVNFLHSSWYEVMLWTFAENCVDNTGMFQFLLSSAYRDPRPSLLLTPPCQWVGWGCTRSWEGTQPGQLTLAEQRAIPYCTMSCSAIKAEGKKEERGMFGVMAFVIPSNRCMWQSPAFLETAEHLPANGKQWTNSLLFFAWEHSFCLPCRTVSISTHEFSHFYLSDSLTILVGHWEWGSSCVGLSCLPVLTRSSCQKVFFAMKY